MADVYPVQMPKITAVSFSINPAAINQPTVLTVKVVEEMVLLAPEIWYSGELYAGEV